MQVIREIREIDSDSVVIHLPKEFRKKKIEITICPVEGGKGKKFSREIEDFLKLGGRGRWEGNLDEMREMRDGIS